MGQISQFHYKEDFALQVWVENKLNLYVVVMRSQHELNYPEISLELGAKSDVQCNAMIGKISP